MLILLQKSFEYSYGNEIISNVICKIIKFRGRRYMNDKGSYLVFSYTKMYEPFYLKNDMDK